MYIVSLLILLVRDDGECASIYPVVSHVQWCPDLSMSCRIIADPPYHANASLPLRIVALLPDTPATRCCYFQGLYVWDALYQERAPSEASQIFANQALHSSPNQWMVGRGKEDQLYRRLDHGAVVCCADLTASSPTTMLFIFPSFLFTGVSATTACAWPSAERIGTSTSDLCPIGSSLDCFRILHGWLILSACMTSELRRRK
jgi:hypothetical protein